MAIAPTARSLDESACSERRRTTKSDTNNLRRGHAPDTNCGYGGHMKNDSQQFADVVQRTRAEYLEMPGLKLTRHQAACLWAIEESLCDAVLATLVHDRFLTRTRSAAFVRSD